MRLCVGRCVCLVLDHVEAFKAGTFRAFKEALAGANNYVKQ